MSAGASPAGVAPSSLSCSAVAAFPAAVHSMGHTIRFFPYRFRLVGVLTAGAFGGAVSVFTQKAYYNKWLRPADAPAVPVPAARLVEAEDADAAVEEAPAPKPKFQAKSLLPEEPPVKPAGARVIDVSLTRLWAILLCIIDGHV